MKNFLIILLLSTLLSNEIVKAEDIYNQNETNIEATVIEEAITSEDVIEEAITIEEVIEEVITSEEENYEELYLEAKATNKELKIKISNLNKEIKSLNKEIKSLHKKIGTKSTSTNNTNNISLNNLSSDETNFKNLYNELNEINKELNVKIKVLNKEIKELNKEIKSLNKIFLEQERLAKLTPTLRIMDGYEYVKESSTGLTFKNLSLNVLNKQVEKYGKLLNKGMPYDEFKETMNYQWIDFTDYKNKPTKVSIDISKNINYNTYVDILKKLSRYDGVYIYKIGESTDGRNLYSIEIDVDSKEIKNVIMLTGQVHARESAGSYFLLKSLADLIQNAQTDKELMNILKKNKYVAVPIINVDARENLINNPSKWTVGGQLWKAYSNGTDGNRNFPGLAWGELSKGNSLKWNVEKKAGRDGYAGDYAGSNKETKAMMKWLYHYSVVEKASCLIDYHQQGRGIYAGKGWATKYQEKESVSFRTKVLKYINNNNSTKYAILEDEPKYGLNGTGSTITDYAAGVAFGAKFSPAYGFNVFTDGKKEYSLLEVLDLDNSKLKIITPNTNFKTLTVEIGYGKSYLGNSAYTRQLLKNEYTKYHFDKLLENLPSLLK